MKKLLGTVVFAAALMYGAVAQAAAINIIATQTAGNQYQLTIETTLPVAAIGINVPVGTTFVINNAAVAPFGSGSSLGDAATPGLLSLNLNPLTCVGINCTPFALPGGSVVIGSFTAPSAGFNSSNPLITPDDDSVGGTAFDGTLVPYDIADIELRTVPEPMTAVMLGLGLAALGLVRRKAA
jgi:hypothetical protein